MLNIYDPHTHTHTHADIERKEREWIARVRTPKCVSFLYRECENDLEKKQKKNLLDTFFIKRKQNNYYHLKCSKRNSTKNTQTHTHTHTETVNSLLR